MPHTDQPSKKILVLHTPCTAGKCCLYCHIADCRLIGRAALCHQLLAQAGILVLVDFDSAQQGGKQLIQHLKARLEAAAGGKLQAYRKQHKPIDKPSSTGSSGA